MQTRLIVRVPMGGHRHRGKVSTLHVLRTCCVWDSIEAELDDFVQQCLYCVESKVEKLKLRSLGELMHSEGIGEAITLIYFSSGR